MGPSQPLFRINILCLQAPSTYTSGAKFVCSIKCLFELGSGSTLANTGRWSLSPFEANVSLGDKYQPCFCSEERNRTCLEQGTCLDWIYPPYLNIRIFMRVHNVFSSNLLPILYTLFIPISPSQLHVFTFLLKPTESS